MQKKLAKQTGRRENKFYYKDVLAILNHQYVRAIQKDELTDYIREIHEKNRIYLDKSWFRDKGLLEKIFIKTESIDHLSDYLIFILLEVVKAFSSGVPETRNKLEKEYIYYILTRLRKLRGIFKEYSTETSIETFSRLFRKIISTIRIPFEGEPLGGIQIMGILETRLLDFKNLIFLSMNEGIMPKTHSFFSYVPNNLRYAFNMPTKEDHDAIYAYYFFRLLQRAQKVNLLYNSKTEGVGTGEKSRYLFQLLYGNKFNVKFKSIGFNIAERNPEPISINKSSEVIKILEKFGTTGSSYLSPSSLSTYLDCRLKFYFSRIADLKEADEAGEEIEAKDMGTLLHETMLRLYNPWIGETITEKGIEKIKHPDGLKSAVDGAFRKEYYKTSDQTVEVYPEGKNIIVYEVIKKYAEKILQTDLELAPFEIIALEEKYEDEIEIETFSGWKKIRIGGKIDRIDRKNGRIRIVDYKTGIAETGIKNINELFDRSVSKRNKAIFQTFVYAWIYDKSHKTADVITTGLYITRKIFNEGFNPVVKLNDNEIDFSNIRDVFFEKLQETISEIYDNQVPFDQTSLEENCRYCDFAEICHRKTLKAFL
jgi:CRISPR/Cas system-associated exonuclease Cas4 (RecB family)